MSVPAQELLRKNSSESIKTTHSEGEKPSEAFSELLKVQEIDERPHRSLFSLIEEEEEKEEMENIMEGFYIPALDIENSMPKETGSISSLSTVLTSDMQALFEKMASRMMVMDLSNETQTTLFLDHPQFANSAFFGTKIVIKEFTSAPKAFNIEIISNPTAIATIQKHQQSLAAVFAQGNFLFTVHRLETQIELDREKPLLHRHEEEGQGQKEQNKDQNS